MADDPLIMGTQIVQSYAHRGNLPRSMRRAFSPELPANESRVK